MFPDYSNLLRLEWCDMGIRKKKGKWGFGAPQPTSWISVCVTKETTRSDVKSPFSRGEGVLMACCECGKSLTLQKGWPLLLHQQVLCCLIVTFSTLIPPHTFIDYSESWVISCSTWISFKFLNNITSIVLSIKKQLRAAAISMPLSSPDFDLQKQILSHWVLQWQCR